MRGFERGRSKMRDEENNGNALYAYRKLSRKNYN